MQDTGDRIKRRRLEGLEHDDLQFAQERMLQATAGADASNPDFTGFLLRQRLLAAEQQQQDAGLVNSFGLQQQLGRSIDPSLVGGGDPVMARMRQNLLNQQLQQAARLQAMDDMSFLRASEAAAAAGPSSIYAASLLAPSRPLSNSLLEHALGNEAGAVTRRGPAICPEQLRVLQMQSLLEAEREEAAKAANQGSIRNLLSLTASEGGSQATLLARHLQNERVMAASGIGTFSPAGIQSLISRAPVGAVTAAGSTLDRDVLLARGVTANYHLGMQLPGTGAMGGIPPGHPARDNKKRPAPQTNPNSTGRQPIHLFMSCDMDDLSPYQCLVRKQIELFEAQEVDAETNARGRNRPIVVGQVGIRCKHCKMLPPRKRERAAIYYPSKLDRLYQAGQTMASVHLGQHCNHIPEHLRQELARLREGKSAALAGKKYWSDGARALGVTEDDDRLFFKRD